MLKKSLSTALVSLFALALSGCASVPNGPVCVSLTPVRGYCIETLSEKEYPVDDVNLLDGKTWRELEMVSLRVPPGYWAQIKAYLLKQCRKNKNCRGDLGKWETKADKVDQAMAVPAE